ADDAEWDIAEGFPNGGVYRGIDAIVSGFFPFLADFDKFYAKGDEYFESGDHVIVLGHYLGVSKKGRRVQSRFAHLWTIRNGKIGRLAADRRHPSHRTSAGKVTGAPRNGTGTAERGGPRV